MVKPCRLPIQDNIRKAQGVIAGEVHEQTAINKLFWAVSTKKIIY